MPYPTISDIEFKNKMVLVWTTLKILNHSCHCPYSSSDRIQIYNKQGPLLDLEIEFFSEILEISRLRIARLNSGISKIFKPSV